MMRSSVLGPLSNVVSIRMEGVPKAAVSKIIANVGKTMLQLPFKRSLSLENALPKLVLNTVVFKN